MWRGLLIRGNEVIALQWGAHTPSFLSNIHTTGAVDSGLLARGVAKRARPAAEADTASFVKTCIGAEKFFGSKLASSAKGRGDGLSAPQTLIERAKQLDFPTAHEIRTTMDRLPPDHLIERRDLHSRYRACFPTWIDELLVSKVVNTHLMMIIT